MSFEYMKGIQQKVDNNEVVKLLRGALSDELIAIHQYWTQMKIIQGVHKDAIIKELAQHRDEETKHANMLMERILQLGGNPEIRPMDWDKFTNCRYKPATNWDQRSILETALSGEKCAIQHYTKLAEFTRVRDITTYDIVRDILEDEYEHVRDLTSLEKMIDQKKESKHAPKNKE